jgi:hypothetical protein
LQQRAGEPFRKSLDPVRVERDSRHDPAPLVVSCCGV